jgi:predicted HNH restriction endonuclease
MRKKPERTAWGSIIGNGTASIEIVLLDAAGPMSVPQIDAEIRRRRLTSRGAIYQHLKTLERKGFIRWSDDGWQKVASETKPHGSPTAGKVRKSIKPSTATAKFKQKSDKGLQQTIIAEELEAPDLYVEGARTTITVNSYERSSKARRDCIANKGVRCEACEMLFEDVYGEIGRGFIHVHHVNMIAAQDEEYKIDWRTDLVPVCANCHAMLHKQNPPLTVADLRSMIAKARQTSRR